LARNRAGAPVGAAPGCGTRARWRFHALRRPLMGSPGEEEEEEDSRWEKVVDLVEGLLAEEDSENEGGSLPEATPCAGLGSALGSVGEGKDLFDGRLEELVSGLWHRACEAVAQVGAEEEHEVDRLLAEAKACQERQRALNQAQCQCREQVEALSMLLRGAVPMTFAGVPAPHLAEMVDDSTGGTGSSAGVPLLSPGSPLPSPDTGGYIASWPAEHTAASEQQVEKIASLLWLDGPPHKEQQQQVALSLHELLAETQSGGTTFTFALRKADGVGLGLQVSSTESEGHLQVRGVLAGGAVEAWNKQCIESGLVERQVCLGDRIVRANDTWGDTELMLKECREKRLVKLTVLRGEVPAIDRNIAAPGFAGLDAKAPAFVPGGGAWNGDAEDEARLAAEREEALWWTELRREASAAAAVATASDNPQVCWPVSQSTKAILGRVQAAIGSGVDSL